MYVNNLSFDPAHQWLEVPGADGVEWALEVFTKDNVYGLDPDHTHFNGGRLTASGLQLLGAQRSVPGRVSADVVVTGDGAVCWDIRASTSEVVKCTKLLLRNLPAEMTNRGWWTATTPADKTLRPTSDAPLLLGYPWTNRGDSWQTPWICAGEGRPLR